MANILARYDSLRTEGAQMILERNLIRERLARLEAAIIRNDRELADLILEAEELALESRLG